MALATRFRKLGQTRAKDKPRLPEQGVVALMEVTSQNLRPASRNHPHVHSDAITDILIVLMAALVLVPLLHRAGISSVLGYLAAGLAIHPRVAVEHPFYTPYLIAVTTGFLFYHWRNPLNLPFNQVFRLPRWRGPAPKGPPAVELATEEEVDRLLDKISTQGLQSLSARERSFLEKASKQRRN